MASPAPITDDTLQADTTAWTTLRDAYINAKASAYSALQAHDADALKFTDATKSFDDKKKNQQDSDFKQELFVDQLFGLAVAAHNKYEGEAGYDADKAWPKAKDLVDTIITDMSDHKSMHEIKSKVIQLNALESFRKTTLSRRQFRQQIMTYMQARCGNRPAEMTEFTKLLTDQRTRIGDPFVSTREST